MTLIPLVQMIVKGTTA